MAKEYAGQGTSGNARPNGWRSGSAPSPVVAEVTRARNIASRYPAARGDMQTLLDDRWELIVNGDGRLELYEYRADSLQQRDLAGDSAFVEVRDALRQRLAGVRRARR